MRGHRGGHRDADLLLGVSTIAIGGAYLWQARRIAPSFLDDVVGTGGVPTLLGVAALACGGVLTARALYARARNGRGSGAETASVVAGAGADEGSHRGSPLVTLLLGVGYGLVLPIAGYAVSIFLLLATVSAYHGGGVRRSGLAVSAVGAVVFWSLFVWLLGIPQPAGLWAGTR